MSLITSCPACGTMFRVVPDQLRISEGWVRCGHCGEIFDAAASLTEQPAPPREPAAAPVTAPRTDPAAMAPSAPVALAPDEAPAADVAPQLVAVGRAVTAEPDDAVAPPADSRPEPQPEPELQPEPNPEPELQPEPQPQPQPQPAPFVPALGNPARPPETAAVRDSEWLEESPRDLPFIFRRSDLVPDDDEPRAESDAAADAPPEPRPARSTGRVASRDAEDERPADSSLDEISFVRQARRRAFWRRPAVRAGLGLCSLLLASLLALQLAYQERDRLAVAVPALAPHLERLCESAGCRLGPPRQIESVVIESSTFTKLRHDTYRLSVNLRSTASLAIAVPAMELTLTDGQDQPVLRRVLTPAELGASAPVLAPGAELALTVGIVVGAPSNARVAGYRLLAFYP